MNSEKIKNEAKQIMDNFMKALQDIEVEEEFILKKEKCYREEGDFYKKTQEETEQFKNFFLKNARETRNDAIVANKGEWTTK